MRRALALLALFALTLCARLSVAAPELRLAPAGDGPVELLGAGGEYLGRFTVQNVGSEPLEAVSLSVRSGGELAPYVPREVQVQFKDGAMSANLAPGAKLEGVVRYTPKRDTRVRRFHGHVLASVSNSPEPTALGFQFDTDRLGGDPLKHAPLGLILVPLLVAFVLLLGGTRLPTGSARKLAGGGALVALGLSIVCFARMDPALTRYDGGQGFHWLSRRVVGAGIEIAYGLDGLAISFAVLVPLLVLAAAALGRNEQRPLIWGALSLVQTALALCVVGQDVATVSAGLLLLAVACLMLTRSRETRRAGYIAAGAALVSAAALWLLAVSSSGLLLDGTQTSRVTSFIELSQVIDHGLLAGGHPARICLPLLLLGLLPLLGVPLVGGYARAIAARSSLPVQMVLLTAVSATAGYLLIRLLVGVMPAGLLWSSTTLAIIGVLGAGVAALSALAHKDPAPLVLSLGGIAASLILVALSALTGAAVQAALLLIVARALSVALVLGCPEAVGGSARDDAPPQHPLLLAGTLIGLAGACGAPATVGFIALSETLIASIPLRPWVVPLVAGAMVVGAGAGFAAIARALVAARRPSDSERTPLQLDEPQRIAVVGLSALIVLLGFAPRVWLLRVDASSLDHADKLNPPGLLEVVQAPTSPPMPAHFS